MQPLAAGFTTTTAQRQKPQSPCHQVQTGPRLALLATYKSDADSRASQSSRDPNPTRHKPAPLKPPPSPTQPSQISFIPSQIKSPEPLRRLLIRKRQNGPPNDRNSLDHRCRQKSHLCTLDIRVFKDLKHGTYTGLVQTCDGHPVVPGCPVCAEEYMAQRAAAYRSTNGAGRGAGQDK
ncbi:hypothetical protein VB005_02797 [Metarhizium brunneum]